LDVAGAQIKMGFEFFGGQYRLGLAGMGQVQGLNSKSPIKLVLGLGSQRVNSKVNGPKTYSSFFSFFSGPWPFPSFPSLLLLTACFASFFPWFFLLLGLFCVSHASSLFYSSLQPGLSSLHLYLFLLQAVERGCSDVGGADMVILSSDAVASEQKTTARATG
jgi:hypothetical protein